MSQNSLPPVGRGTPPPHTPRLGAYGASPLGASIIEPPSGMSGYGPALVITN